MSDFTRAAQLERALERLLAEAPELEAVAVVSFDGLPMASALPASMDEDRVAAMSAALLSLGERAAEGLGRGGLNQVYIEGEHGTVFLVAAADEAVVVAVAARGAKVGMMLFEVRRAASEVAGVLRAAVPAAPVQPAHHSDPVAPAPVTQLQTVPQLAQVTPLGVATTSFEEAGDPLVDPLPGPGSAPVEPFTAWSQGTQPPPQSWA